MGEGRQRLRPFLERILNQGQVPGVKWLNEEHTKFEIPWKHGGKQSWSAEDGQIFKEYASMMSNDAVHDWDKGQCKAWKHKLRCALNKAGGPFIYLKEESTQDVRVYELKTGRVKTCVETPENSPPALPHPTNPAVTYNETQGFTYNTTVTSAALKTELTAEGATGSCLPTTVELMNTDSDSLDIKNSSFTRLYDPHFKTPSDVDVNMSSLDKYLPVPQTQAAAPVLDVACSPAPTQLQPYYRYSFEALSDEVALEAASPTNDICVTLVYNRSRVETRRINCPHGLRICHNSAQRCQNALATSCHQQLYGSELASVVEFEDYQSKLEDKRLGSLFNSLLTQMSRGIVITAENGNLYAQRMSKLAVFYASNIGTNGEPIKLSRDEKPTLIFDYENHFLAALGQTLTPDIEVHLQFGQKSSLDDTNPSNCLLSAVLVSGLALDHLEKLQSVPASSTYSMQMSTSDEFDKIDQFMGVSQGVKMEELLSVQPGTSNYLTMDGVGDHGVASYVSVKSEEQLIEEAVSAKSEEQLIDETANLSLDDTFVNSGESFSSCQSSAGSNINDKTKE